MLSKLLLAWLLMALCVVVHAATVTWIVRWVRRQTIAGRGFWAWTWLFVHIAGWIIAIHLVEISAWAALYTIRGAIPDVQSSLYFSAVTYTTTGYGDIVLPMDWRLVGGVEALTGILMCGLSSGLFFAIVSRMVQADKDQPLSSQSSQRPFSESQ